MKLGKASRPEVDLLQAINVSRAEDVVANLENETPTAIHDNPSVIKTNLTQFEYLMFAYIAAFVVILV